MSPRNPEGLPACFECGAFRRVLHPFTDQMGNPMPLCGPCLDKFQLMSLVNVLLETDPELTHEEAEAEVRRRLAELTADLQDL